MFLLWKIGVFFVMDIRKTDNHSKTFKVVVLVWWDYLWRGSKEVSFNIFINRFKEKNWSGISLIWWD